MTSLLPVVKYPTARVIPQRPHAEIHRGRLAGYRPPDAFGREEKRSHMGLLLLDVIGDSHHSTEAPPLQRPHVPHRDNVVGHELGVDLLENAALHALLNYPTKLIMNHILNIIKITPCINTHSSRLMI